MKDKAMKGADIAIKCLERADVKTIFAYPGGASMELHQSLRKSSIRVILPRNEQGGAFAAAGFARATGKTGVVMATSGPGATNLITGIADAYMDSIPLVAITGQVPSSLIGKTAFQETDIIGITRPIVKHSYLILHVEDIPAIFEEAFFLANSGRPGPVVIDLPKDLQQAMDVPKFPKKATVRAYTADHKIRESDIDAISKAIKTCSKPCIYAGGGIITSGAAASLKKFAESYNIPVVTTLMGVGGFPETSPLSLKWLGMHGTVYGNNAANECDLLITLGARFDDRVTGPTATFATGAKIIHVDIDPSEFNKNKTADIAVLGNVKDVLDALNKTPFKQNYTDWFKQIKAWKKDFPLSYNKKSKQILPQEAVEEIYNQTKGKAVIVPGVGQHQMWAAQFYEYTTPRQLLTSGGLGTMGFGLPSAMEAKIALPGKTVICIDGDGSAQMNIQELGTIHNENIDVKIVILNNQHLGMVAQWEDRFYGSERGNTVLINKRVQRPYPDFVTIAKGYAIPGREVYNKADLKDAIKEMLNSKGAYLLDVHVEYQEHVLPMIPPGTDYKGILVK
jgi:acetolactate synthase I/II/III large subunit